MRLIPAKDKLFWLLRQVLMPFLLASMSSVSMAADRTPPTAPTGLSATTRGSTSINLSWTASTDDVGVTAYLLERCQGSTCTNFAQIASVNPGTSYTDLGLTTATTYKYRVRARDAANNKSPYSNVATAKTGPAAPTNLTATVPSPSRVNLTWTASPGAASYQVLRTASLAGPTACIVPQFSQIGSSTATSYSDTTVAPDGRYCYGVTALDTSGNPSDTATVPVQVDTTAPTAPTNLTFSSVKPTQVSLRWNAATDNVAVADYTVSRCPSPCTLNQYQAVGSTPNTNLTDTTVSASSNYVYKVTANDTSGNHADSGPASVTTPAATATVPASLSPNPLALNVGSTGTVTVALSPTPSSSGTLALTSSNASVATVPASVGYSAGQTSVLVTVSPVASGTTVISATANSGLASGTVNVNAVPTVSLTSPTNGATFTAPATIPLSATASDSDGSISRVEFYYGSTLITTLTTSPYSFSWTNVPQGTYSLTARAIDNSGGAATSAAISVTVNSAVAQLYFIEVDHLNTPRLVSDSQQHAVWRWDQQEPFGINVPDENPSALGAFDFSLRLPGQYFDKETNLHYNYSRDYDASIGRYEQSDPIGLRGGLNTYTYVGTNPISISDPMGLAGRLKPEELFDQGSSLGMQKAGQFAGTEIGKVLCNSGTPPDFRTICFMRCLDVTPPASNFAADFQDGCQEGCVATVSKCRNQKRSSAGGTAAETQSSALSCPAP